VREKTLFWFLRWWRWFEKDVRREREWWSDEEGGLERKCSGDKEEWCRWGSNTPIHFPFTLPLL